MAEKIYIEGKKSPYNFEVCDSNDEKRYAEALDADDNVLAWTKSHKIVIRYRNKKGTIGRYYPDFLVRRKNQNELELVEIKGAHLNNDPNVEMKRKAAEDWCIQRGMKYIKIVK
ncbi:MAG: TnsA endonuclease N-terminal domain-containing protein [Bdellovibrionaceae bacterium]|nr:TnsA endonuclease N-terminal domain-containing protein [Pseudobdellovibrionaceae bacterium]